MGIDIYMRWDGQTDKEIDAQYDGFDPTIGHVGYLREAYFKDTIYSTKMLLKEGFEEDSPASIKLSSEVLQKRLDLAVKLHQVRYKNAYNLDVVEDDQSSKSFKDFVALHTKLEKQGKNPTIIVDY